MITPLKYPSKVNAVEVETMCTGKTLIFTVLGKQLIGTLHAEDGDPLALRLKTAEGIKFIATGVDVYPALGIITFCNELIIKQGYVASLT